MLSRFSIGLITALTALSPLSAAAQMTPIPSETKTQSSPVAAPMVEGVYGEMPGEHVMGDPDAPVTVIAYASVMCPHCADWFTNDWPTFKADYIETGKVRFVFREFITSPQELAVPQFILASCAPKEDYFDALTEQMLRQDEIKSAAQNGTYRAIINELGETAGMKTEDEIKSCINDPKGLKRLQVAQDRSRAAKLNAVPGFIIQGEVFKGNATAENLGKAITAHIK